MQGAYILNIFKTHSSSLTTRKSLGHSQKTLAAKNPQNKSAYNIYNDQAQVVDFETSVDPLISATVDEDASLA